MQSTYSPTVCIRPLVYLLLNSVGLLLISAAQTLGVFDTLEELDLSDIGCATDTIALFAKAIVDRFKVGKCGLKK
jgi:hypothetical protein